MKLFDNDINKEKNTKEENTEMKNDEKENERENDEMTVKEKKFRENIFLKYKKLREDIEKYNHFYYNEDNPLISDREYDDLIKKLENMEKEYPELKDISNENSSNADIIKEKKIKNMENARKDNIKEKETLLYSTFSDIELEKNNIKSENRKNLNLSPTEKIGGTASEKFSKVIHSVPMLSLSNTYNISEIEDFNQRAKK